MALQQDSELAKLAAAMRSATAEDNPFTTPDAAEAVPDVAVRASLGGASVALLYALADFVALYSEAQQDPAKLGDELSDLLERFGDAINAAGHADALAVRKAVAA